MELKNAASARFLTDLHDGEAEVVALAEELGASLLLVGEALARDYERLLGFRVSGTLGILLRARREGRIDAIAPLLNLLLANGYRLSERLVRMTLQAAGEAP